MNTETSFWRTVWSQTPKVWKFITWYVAAMTAVYIIGFIVMIFVLRWDAIPEWVQMTMISLLFPVPLAAMFGEKPRRVHTQNQ